MLTAHANTTTKDFIAQLRTFVIAFGCNACVVDCVDNLVGADDLQAEHEKELQELEGNTAVNAKTEILKAVREWATESLGEVTMKELLSVIEDVI